MFAFLVYFREFFYIQMEKYARQALSEGVKSDSELHVTEDAELYRVINVHYNRNNHIEVSFKTECLSLFFLLSKKCKYIFSKKGKKDTYSAITICDDDVTNKHMTSFCVWDVFIW